MTAQGKMVDIVQKDYLILGVAFLMSLILHHNQRTEDLEWCKQELFSVKLSPQSKDEE